MHGSMVDIQSATAEKRRGKKERETTAAKYNGLPYWVAIKICARLSARISPQVRSIANFLCMLPMSVARSFSSILTIGHIAYWREGVTGVHGADNV